MTTVYCAKWVLPISSPPINDGAIAIIDDRVAAVGTREELLRRFTDCEVKHLGDSAILPGFINSHSHLELTAMRGFLDDQEKNFFAWLRKLTLARLQMTPEDLYVSAAWGACEAVRAGVTCLGDSSDSAATTIRALNDVGLRAVVFQESFGPDPSLAEENFKKLQEKVVGLRRLETALVRAGVSPHAPYTVCGPQLRMIAAFAVSEQLPLMMHAAESQAEEMLVRDGSGVFADGLQKRSIAWQAPGVSTVRYLEENDILKTQPLLAHCINVDSDDIQLLKEMGSRIAHCPRSNAKLGHGRAPLKEFLKQKLPVGLGTDSVASNNSGDVLSEARFAILTARNSSSAEESEMLTATAGLQLATSGGASALSMRGKTGELREGLQADFVAVSLNGTHQLPSYDLEVTLLFSSSGSDVKLTVVNGKEVFVDGLVTTVDETGLREELEKIAIRLGS